MNFSLDSWEKLHQLSGFLANISVLMAAGFAVVKFRLFNVPARRWRSEVTCTHWTMKDGSALVKVQFTIHNTGARMIEVEQVTIKLVGVKKAGDHLGPDTSKQLAGREVITQGSELEGLRRIKSGERSIFNLNWPTSSLPETFYIVCTSEIRKEAPAQKPFRELYCTNPVAGTSAKSSQALSVSEALTKATGV